MFISVWGPHPSLTMNIINPESASMDTLLSVLYLNTLTTSQKTHVCALRVTYALIINTHLQDLILYIV